MRSRDEEWIADAFGLAGGGIVRSQPIMTDAPVFSVV